MLWKIKLVLKIKSCGFKVFVYQDDSNNDTPDSIYPNNWITFRRASVSLGYVVIALAY